MARQLKLPIETNTMKTITNITVALVTLVITSTAQVKVKSSNNGPKPGVLVPHTPPTNQAAASMPSGNGSGSANGAEHWGPPHGWNNNGGAYASINIGFGNYPYGNPYPYSGYYGNGYSIKKSAKQTMRAASHIIGEAVGFTAWHDLYSPLLAKAIRHYNYSKQLYWWGNYHAAMNHAERARYLAWYSLQCFQDPNYYYGGYNGNGYNEPNPYSDPYNPYYKNGTASGDRTNKAGEADANRALPKEESIDAGLPAAEADDRSLIRSFDKSTFKDE